MINNYLYSDQLINWSDNYETTYYLLFAKKKKTSNKQDLFDRSRYPQRFVNRTLQTLWKTRLQMFERTRSWSQILPVDKLSQSKSNSGLCPTILPTTSKTIFIQLQRNSRNVKGNLRDKSGNPAPQKGIVKIKYGYHKSTFQLYKYRNCRKFSLQYASGFLCRKNSYKGGKS